MALKGGSRGPVNPVSIEEMLQNLRREVHWIKEASENALDVVVHKIGVRSQELVPVATGHLKSTFGTRTFRNRQNEVTVILYYTADYALWVHEINAHHASPTQWKYLQTAIDEYRGEIMQDLAASVRANRSGAGIAGAVVGAGV